MQQQAMNLLTIYLSDSQFCLHFPPLPLPFLRAVKKKKVYRGFLCCARAHELHFPAVAPQVLINGNRMFIHKRMFLMNYHVKLPSRIFSELQFSLIALEIYGIRDYKIRCFPAG